jgi:hypothetical protein
MERPSASMRNPSVTPACGTGRAITLADPMEKSSDPTSMVMSSPRNCSMWMGKTGGCTAACSASFNVPLGCAGPYTVRRAPGSWRGPKNGIPRMWSKWRWVSSAVACMGVPRARTSRCSTSP